LKRRLRERGYLKSVDEPRKALTIRKRFGGKDMHFLHLYRQGPFGRTSPLRQEPAKPANGEEDSGESSSSHGLLSNGNPPTPANDNAEPTNVGGFEADNGGLNGKTRQTPSVKNPNKYKDNPADEPPVGGFGGFFSDRRDISRRKTAKGRVEQPASDLTTPPAPRCGRCGHKVGPPLIEGDLCQDCRNRPGSEPGGVT
jgi:hypothetical protein